MNDKKITENLIKFSDELGMIGLQISKEIYGQTYLEEEDLQQRIGHIFLKKNYPVLREVGLPKKVFDVTFKKGEFPDFVFFDNTKSDFLAPFLIEFKHKDKITDQFRAQLGRQLNLAQETVVNNNKNLKFGFVWNIVKTDFELDKILELEAKIEEFENIADIKDEGKMLSKLLNLYMIEYNFYKSGKERDKVLKKIKLLLESINLQAVNVDKFFFELISDFESFNKSFNPSVQDATITKGVSMKIKKPDVRVEVELWKLTNGKNHELGIELVERKTYG